jgi:hypothetical protein
MAADKPSSTFPIFKFNITDVGCGELCEPHQQQSTHPLFNQPHPPRHKLRDCVECGERCEPHPTQYAHTARYELGGGCYSQDRSGLEGRQSLVSR